MIRIRLICQKWQNDVYINDCNSPNSCEMPFLNRVFLPFENHMYKFEKLVE